MKLSDWLLSLTSKDQITLVGLYIISIYFSKVTLNGLIELYNEKKNYSNFRLKLRITPVSLLSLAFIYCIILYKVFRGIFSSIL
jgi:hypothetical protein